MTMCEKIDQNVSNGFVYQAFVRIGQAKYHDGLQAEASVCETGSHVAIAVDVDVKLRVNGPDT